MTELKFEKKVIGTQMEEERAAVWFKISKFYTSSKANRETFNFSREFYGCRGSKKEESTPSQKQEGVSRYYVDQHTLRQYGQELPEFSQPPAFTEICRPPVKVLEDEVWSQEAEATIDTDIGSLQTLRDLVGNPEVSNQPIGQGMSQFNKQCQQ
ncbi:Hypothetical predicted protein [Paramuricea clavata]|uniref:Uncharacterized protein n=1 Tax=Paramuricea clavata TaxID=317549 RepID=A0A7D9DX50_PARCT|nr:Hypothetical predicted protein [Paramuricea clavata]